MRNVSNVSVWPTCLSKSLNSFSTQNEPVCHCDHKKTAVSGVSKDFRKASTRPSKDSIDCFVFASCALFSPPLEFPRVSLSSRRGQGAMFSQPSLKALQMRMLNDETSVPSRAKGQATFKTPEDQNLLSGKHPYITRFCTRGMKLS